VSVLNAAGICRLLETPSFWRKTSQCALAVRAEMPSLSPTSSFEQPRAISSTTWRCRSVSEKSVSFRVLVMDADATCCAAPQPSAGGSIRRD